MHQNGPKVSILDAGKSGVTDQTLFRCIFSLPLVFTSCLISTFVARSNAIIDLKNIVVDEIKVAC